MQEISDWLLRVLFYPLGLLQRVRYLELELTFQDLFLLAYLIDNESLIFKLYHIENLLVLVFADSMSLNLVFNLFEPFESKVIQHWIFLLQRYTLHSGLVLANVHI